MAIFSKKRTLDDILKDIDALSPEEKAEIGKKMQDLYKAEDEREIDKIEETKADSAEVADEKAEEVKDESEVIGKDVDEVEKEVKADETPAEEAKTEDVEKEPVEGEADPEKADKTAEVLKGITDRLGALEGVISELTELKEKMDEYVKKQEESFGYKSDFGSDGNKSMDDMSAEELKHKLLYQ